MSDLTNAIDAWLAQGADSAEPAQPFAQLAESDELRDAINRAGSLGITQDELTQALAALTGRRQSSLHAELVAALRRLLRKGKP